MFNMNYGYWKYDPLHELGAFLILLCKLKLEHPKEYCVTPERLAIIESYRCTYA